MSKMINCGIYKITSPTGKIYIGQAVNLERRIKGYNKQQDRIKSQRKLYNSLKKYGFEAHQFDIIEYCSEEDLNCSERFWQDKFDVLGKNGLNCILQECGEKRRVLSEETRKKLSDAGKKRVFTEETLKKRSESLKRTFAGRKSKFFGVPRTAEDKEKISKGQIGKTVSEETRKKIGDANRGQKRTFSKEHLESISKASEARIGKPDYSKRKTILCLRTGIFYFGIEEAAEARGISKSMVTEHMTRLKVNRLDLIYV